MTWAVNHWPELVEHTKTPAMHWWTPSNARKRLVLAGFGEIWDRWDLRAQDEESGIRQGFFNLASETAGLRAVLGEVVIPDCAFAAGNLTAGLFPLMNGKLTGLYLRRG